MVRPRLSNEVTRRARHTRADWSDV